MKQYIKCKNKSKTLLLIRIKIEMRWKVNKKIEASKNSNK